MSGRRYPPAVRATALAMMADGCDNRTIADALGIAIYPVQSWRYWTARRADANDDPLPRPLPVEPPPPHRRPLAPGQTPPPSAAARERERRRQWAEDDRKIGRASPGCAPLYDGYGHGERLADG